MVHGVGGIFCFGVGFQGSFASEGMKHDGWGEGGSVSKSWKEQKLAWPATGDRDSEVGKYSMYFFLFFFRFWCRCAWGFQSWKERVILFFFIFSNKDSETMCEMGNGNRIVGGKKMYEKKKKPHPNQ